MQLAMTGLLLLSLLALCHGGSLIQGLRPEFSKKLPISYGCFKDHSGARDLTVLAKKGFVTAHGCMYLCRGMEYKLFGLQNGSECWCGNSHGRHGRAKLANCNLSCTGDRRQNCGGKLHNRIYPTKHARARKAILIADRSPSLSSKSKGSGSRQKLKLKIKVKGRNKRRPVVVKKIKVQNNQQRTAKLSKSGQRHGLQLGLRFHGGLQVQRPVWKVKKVKKRSQKLKLKIKNRRKPKFHQLLAGGRHFRSQVFATKKKKLSVKLLDRNGSKSRGKKGGKWRGKKNGKWRFKKGGKWREKRSGVGRGSVRLESKVVRKYASLLGGAAKGGIVFAKRKPKFVVKSKSSGGGASVRSGKVKVSAVNNRSGSATSSSAVAVGDSSSSSISSGSSSHTSSSIDAGGRTEVKTITSVETKTFESEAAGLGCFKDSATARDLPFSASFSGPMTVEKCMQACADKKHRYFGLQAGSQCWCGDSYGKHGGPVDDAQCNQKCSGNSSQVCGGTLFNSIFDSGKR